MKNTVFTVIAVLLATAQFAGGSPVVTPVVMIKGLSMGNHYYEGKQIPDSGGNAFILLEQWGQTCGPTSLEMVLHYYGVDATMAAIWRKGDIHSVVTGTWPDEMRQALNGLGVPSYWYVQSDDPFGALRFYVDQNRPPCILLRYRGAQYHWVVVVGYNWDTNEYLIADPAYPRFEWISQGVLSDQWGFRTVAHSAVWDGRFRKEPFIDAAASTQAKPYTVIVPRSAPTREHFSGMWSEMLHFRMTGTGRLGGSTRGWEKTLAFDKKFDFYQYSAIEEMSSKGTATLNGHKRMGDRRVKLWGRIEDGLVLRGRMNVMVRTYRYRK